MKNARLNNMNAVQKIMKNVLAKKDVMQSHIKEELLIMKEGNQI